MLFRSIASAGALCLTLAACAGSAERDRNSRWYGRTAGVVEIELQHATAQLRAGWLEKSTKARADGHLRYARSSEDGNGSAEEGWYRLRKHMRVGPHYYGRIATEDGAFEFCALSSRRSGSCENGECTTVIRWDDCTALAPR
ncbi:hypothetical protein PRJ39_14445 [Lysobacter enzymogenes]|uniref:hypothetical protein n=1 Tax=Lysobacter enzymogenes TaxID=69 RepID=UPI0037490EBA